MICSGAYIVERPSVTKGTPRDDRVKVTALLRTKVLDRLLVPPRMVDWASDTPWRLPLNAAMQWEDGSIDFTSRPLTERHLIGRSAFVCRMFV